MPCDETQDAVFLVWHTAKMSGALTDGSATAENWRIPTANVTKFEIEVPNQPALRVIPVSKSYWKRDSYNAFVHN